jgi:hypothetical protein
MSMSLSQERAGMTASGIRQSQAREGPDHLIWARIMAKLTRREYRFSTILKSRILDSENTEAGTRRWPRVASAHVVVRCGSGYLSRSKLQSQDVQQN